MSHVLSSFLKLLPPTPEKIIKTSAGVTLISVITLKGKCYLLLVSLLMAEKQISSVFEFC